MSTKRKTPEQIHVEQLVDGFRMASERAQLYHKHSRSASKKGKKFKSVYDVKLRLNAPYFVRRAWFDSKDNYSKVVGVDTPHLALWTENGWSTIEGSIPCSTDSSATIQVWS